MSEGYIEGVITAGLGEGAYFMSLPHYKKEIKNKLDFDAYPGTLNIKIEIGQIDQIKKTDPIKITGFKEKNKTFGGASCYKAKIEDVDGAIIIPDINKHKDDIIEFIAPVSLKSKLNIKNGDKIKIQISNLQ